MTDLFILSVADEPEEDFRNALDLVELGCAPKPSRKANPSSPTSQP
jgi:hypothetical protein